MSSEKKFRIQNGLDVAGEVLVNGINIVGADGVLNQASYQTAVQAMIDATVAQGVDQNSIDTAVSTAVAALADSAPETLDTLNELAAALGDDADFATSMTNALNTKLTAANNLSDVADAAAARSNLGLGTAATAATTSFATAAQGTKADNAATQADLTALESQITNGVATTAQGALADTAVQPEDLTTGFSTITSSDWSNHDLSINSEQAHTTNGRVAPAVASSSLYYATTTITGAGTTGVATLKVYNKSDNSLKVDLTPVLDAQTFYVSSIAMTDEFVFASLVVQSGNVENKLCQYRISDGSYVQRLDNVTGSTFYFGSNGAGTGYKISCDDQYVAACAHSVNGSVGGNVAVVLDYVNGTHVRSITDPFTLATGGFCDVSVSNGKILFGGTKNDNSKSFRNESVNLYDIATGNVLYTFTLQHDQHENPAWNGIGFGATVSLSPTHVAISSQYSSNGQYTQGKVDCWDISGNFIATISEYSNNSTGYGYGMDLDTVDLEGSYLYVNTVKHFSSSTAVKLYIYDLSGATPATAIEEIPLTNSGRIAASPTGVVIAPAGHSGLSYPGDIPTTNITVLSSSSFVVDDSLFATRAYADSAVAGVDLSNYTNTTDMTSAIATAKSEAVTLAATDATTKADAAQAAAEAFATTAAANAAAGVVDSAPEALNTLNELAAALGDDANFATTVTNSLASKASSADLSTTQSEVTALQGMVGTQTYEAFGTVTGGNAVALTSTGKVTQISSNIPDMNETYTSLGTNIEKKAMFMDWDTVNNQLIVMAQEKQSNYAQDKVKISAVTPDPMSLETIVNYSFSSPSASNSNNYVYQLGENNSKKAIMSVIPGTAYYVLVNAERERIVLFYNNGSSISQVSIDTFDRAQQNYLYHAVVDGELHLFYKQNGVGWGEENNNNVMGTKVSVYNGSLVLGTEYTLYSAASNQSDFENYFFGTYQSNKIMPDKTTVETIDGQDWMFMLHSSQTEHWQKITAMKVDVSNEQLSFGDAKQHSYAGRTSGNYHVDGSVGNMGQDGGWISYSAYSGNIVVPMKSGSSNTYIRAMVLEFDSGGDLVEKAFISPLISDQGNQTYNSIAVATSSLSDTVTFMYGRAYYGDNGWGYVLGTIDSSGSWTELEKYRGQAHTYSDSSNGGATGFCVFDGPELNGHSVFLRNNTSGSNSGTGVEVKAHISRMTPVSNTAQWIGIATSTQTDGENVQVAIKNSSTTVLTGLSVGSTYYVQDDGSVTTTESDYIAGLALTSDKLLLEGADLSPYATTAELAATLSQAQAYADSASSVAATGVDFSNEIAAARSGAVADVAASDLDMGGNKVLFGNVYSNLADLPDASTYHGMFAHVHATGKGYFAHAGNWVELANTSDLLTQSDIDTAVAAVIDSAPDALNTLNELAAALGDDANFASTVTTSLATKADLTYVDAQIAGIDVNAQVDLTDYSTTAEMNTAITNAVSAGTVDLSSYSTTVEMNTAIDTAVANVVDVAPDALNTLNELSAALGDDANFATTMTTALATKADASAVATSAQGALADTAIQPEDLTTGFSTSTSTSPDWSSTGTFSSPLHILTIDENDLGLQHGVDAYKLRSGTSNFFSVYSQGNGNSGQRKFIHVVAKNGNRVLKINLNEAGGGDSDSVIYFNEDDTKCAYYNTTSGMAYIYDLPSATQSNSAVLLNSFPVTANYRQTIAINGGYFYSAVSDGNVLYQYDISTGALTNSVTLPTSPSQTGHPDSYFRQLTRIVIADGKAFVSDEKNDFVMYSNNDRNNGGIYVVDLSTFTVVHTIPNPQNDRSRMGTQMVTNGTVLAVNRYGNGVSGNQSYDDNVGAVELFSVSDYSHLATITNPSVQGFAGPGDSGPNHIDLSEGFLFVGSKSPNQPVTQYDLSDYGVEATWTPPAGSTNEIAVFGDTFVRMVTVDVSGGQHRFYSVTAESGIDTVTYVVDDSIFATKAYVDSGVAGVDLSAYTTTADLTSSDLDLNGNKVLFGNVYSTLADLPSATTYHGMFAHVHATGKGYFAHAGNWVELANAADLLAQSDIDTAVTTAVADVVDAAPDSLNTLNELAAALGDDANFASTVTTSLASKADSATVTASLADKADVTYVNSEIAGLNATIANINVTGDITSALDSYSTTAQMNTAIATAVSGVDLSNYSTTTQMNTAISTAVDGLVDSAPGALDTLNELASALGDDANFASTMTTALAGKATTAQGALADTAVQPDDLASGFSLSTGTVIDPTSAATSGNAVYSGNVPIEAVNQDTYQKTGTDGTYLVVYHPPEGTMKVYSATDGSFIKKISNMGGLQSVRTLRVANGKILAAAANQSSWQGAVALFDIASGNVDWTKYGTGANKYFGRMIAMSDTAVAVHHWPDSGNTRAGAVTIYDIAGNELYTYTGTTNDERLGLGLAVSSNHFAYSSGGSNYSGTKQVIVRSISDGSVVATIDDPTPGSNETYGGDFGSMNNDDNHISMTDSYIAIGAPYESHTVDGVAHRGKVYIYNLSGSLVTTFSNIYGHDLASHNPNAVFGGTGIKLDGDLLFAGTFAPDMGGSEPVNTDQIMIYSISDNEHKATYGYSYTGAGSWGFGSHFDFENGVLFAGGGEPNGSIMNMWHFTGSTSTSVSVDGSSLSVDNADKLDGQHGTHYRINIYDVNGTLVN